MNDEDIKDLSLALIRTAQSSGELIMRYRAGETNVDFKADGSPVTDADKAAEEMILNDLARLAPGLAVVAEESASAIGADFDADAPFFLVDPLDGTRDFVRGGQDFTVNIALIRDRFPVFGLIYAPASQRLFITLERDAAYTTDLQPSRGAPFTGLKMTPLKVRSPAPEKLRVLASRSHLNEKTAQFIERLNVGETLQFSSSLKFAIIAEGTADVYPRLAPTCEWDTAAGQAILAAAGGSVVDESGAILSYGHVERKFLNPGFIAWGGVKP
jgi:3'(2'), 5'-bisphosphate nucleotidase